jgi:hypothetical protein
MLDSKSDAELGAMVRDRYERLMDAHAGGLSDEHPVAQWNNDNLTLRAHRAAKDAAGSGLGARELEERDQPRPQTATDDPTPHTTGTPPNPQRPGAELAAHDAAVRAAIPGLDRLRGPFTHHDKRVVDDDLIVQSRRSW